MYESNLINCGCRFYFSLKKYVCFRSTSDRVVEVSPRYGVSPTDCRARTPPPPYNNNFLNTPGAPHVHQSVTQVQPQTGITETILVPETRNTGQESGKIYSHLIVGCLSVLRLFTMLRLFKIPTFKIFILFHFL